MAPPPVSSDRVLEPTERESVMSGQELVEQGHLLTPGVVELACDGGLARGTSLALCACRKAQRDEKTRSGQSAWCAFVDPTRSLYAPGVQARGVDLERLLVVRPDEEALSRVALRLVESKVFPVVVVDLMGIPGSGLNPHLGSWVRVVRRLSLALERSTRSVILLTDKSEPRALPLPVTRRIELSRPSPFELQFQITKDSRGAGLRKARVPWVRSRTLRGQDEERRHAS